MPKYQPATDYADDDATQLDREPHWSSLRQSIARMGTASVRRVSAPRSVPPARSAPPAIGPAPVLLRALPPATAPAISGASSSTASALPPRLPPAVQRSATTSTPPAPLPIVETSNYMLPFYSYSESQTQYGLETERVAPLPMSDLRPDWYVTLAKLWSRFAAPACGAIAGLIFVVGYLAYASQNRGALAASATPAPRIVMPVEVAVAAPAPEEVRAPTITTLAVADDDAPIAKAKRPTAKRVVTKRLSSNKRRPIRLNDATPLGDLRPSRR